MGSRKRSFSCIYSPAIRSVSSEERSRFLEINTSLLTDETYIAALRENHQRFKAKYVDLPDLGLKWDLIKMGMIRIHGTILEEESENVKGQRNFSVCRKR